MSLIPSVEAFLVYMRMFKIQKTSWRRKRSIKLSRLGGVMGLSWFQESVLEILPIASAGMLQPCKFWFVSGCVMCLSGCSSWLSKPKRCVQRCDWNYILNLSMLLRKEKNKNELPIQTHFHSHLVSIWV